MQYQEFFSQFAKFPRTKLYYETDKVDIVTLLINDIYNLMIEKRYDNVLRMLEGLDTDLRRNYIMNKVLKVRA